MPARPKRVIAIICFVIAAAAVIAVIIISSRGNDYSTVVWYTPHPDDETLFMGGAIHKEIQSGKENILVLFTRGGASRVIHNINEELPADHEKLTEEQFMQARVNEFLLAADLLGVKPENVIVLDYADGTLAEEEIYRVILDLAERYPGASHRTLSWHDDHPDHAALGKALLRAYREGAVAEARFFLKFEFIRAAGTGLRFNYLYGEHFPAKKEALEAYGKWDPGRGWYAIGQTSVSDYFKRAGRSRFEYYHFP